MDKETHVPKKIMVNGKEKTVYVRTEETEQALEHYRLGFFSGVDPLPLASFGDKLKEKQLIILAPYPVAKSVIRTRLELDKRPHKVMTGTTLVQCFFDNDNYKYGFPIFKQFYLLFGYSESTNRRMHEIIFDILFTRYHEENHFWMIIPRTLGAMAAQWGSALMQFQMFPVLDLLGEGQEITNLVSVANPTTSEPAGSLGTHGVFKDSSYNEEFDEFAVPRPISDNPEEARRQERDWEKWRKKLYE